VHNITTTTTIGTTITTTAVVTILHLHGLIPAATNNLQ
jgi:hypothetical protein